MSHPTRPAPIDRAPRPAGGGRRPATAVVVVGAVALAVTGAGAAGAPVGPSAAARAAGATLSSGHVDVVAPRVVRGRLRLDVRDTTRGAARWRRPGDVTVRVTDRARVRLGRGQSAVGRAGSTAWVLPQSERRGVVWAGWSTQALTARDLRGGLRWSLRSVRGPGRMVLFQSGAFGDASVLFSSAVRGGQTRGLAPGAHGHGNWAFTRRGTYRVTFALSGTSRTGRALRASGTLRFRVG